ncbi:MAG TPA: glycosyltransferase family 87 protein [Candidatus Dormibacteraeota bacterium]|nr:glycosyltransferase family 87 protein [Candidatus Dormibacteraeota bacterium]
MPERLPARLPPLWLSASALAAAITCVFGVARWIDHFISDPAAQDLRLHLVAARVGLTYGWGHIYDVSLQKHVAAALGPSGSVIDSMHVFISPPPTAWMLVPLAWQPPAVSFLVWTVISVVAFVAAGWLIVPGPRFARLTVLLVSLALYPVHYELWQGQTVIATLALLAVAYRLLEREQWVLSGLALAAAFCFKPQDALLVPIALLISGRWRPIMVFAVAGSVIAAVSALSLGMEGINSWLSDLALVQGDPHNAAMSYSYLFGRNEITTAIEVALGCAAIAIAWIQRRRVDLVFAAALVGSTMSASYLHEHDITILVLGAWIVLRAGPSVAQRFWLLAGIAAAQFIAIGQPIPMLLWEPAWAILLGLEARFAPRPVAHLTESPAALT